MEGTCVLAATQGWLADGAPTESHLTSPAGGVCLASVLSLETSHSEGRRVDVFALGHLGSSRHYGTAGDAALKPIFIPLHRCPSPSVLSDASSRPCAVGEGGAQN